MDETRIIQLRIFNQLRERSIIQNGDIGNKLVQHIYQNRILDEITGDGGLQIFLPDIALLKAIEGIIDDIVHRAVAEGVE